ncbi:unnamed protein product [Staurois parvus]|uniref:Uncharacterized protein n=1 Tax=Staurois parvus TaxID=386267 RepID=A0ABN9HGE9_9NEOB|nr:unnamed protein product [Staurois parvus]
MYTDHQGTDDQCALIISVAPSMPPGSAHQGHLSVPISAISMPHISTYQWTSMPHISAHLSCLSVPSINASQCCQSVPPVSAAYQCASVLHVSAAYQCRLTMPVSAT